MTSEPTPPGATPPEATPPGATPPGATAPMDGARLVVELGSGGATAEDVLAVARAGARVRLTAEALDAMAASRRFVEDLAAGAMPVYGISTGFGALATRHIGPEMRTQLQASLLRSHAAGMGSPVDAEVVRGLMFLRLRTLATGRTGVRTAVAQTIAAVLNAGITPVVPENGSLGCSGDLAPLAHCALTLVGEGEVAGPDGRPVPSNGALAAAGIVPYRPRGQGGPRPHQRH